MAGRKSDQELKNNLKASEIKALPYNAMVKQIEFPNLTLSTGNFPQFYLLSLIHPLGQDQSPFAKEDLNVFENNDLLMFHAEQVIRYLHREIESQKSLRLRLAIFYGHVTTVVRFRPLPKNNEGLAHQIAKKLAQIYTQIDNRHLQITLDDVKNVITEHLQKENLEIEAIDDAFVNKIVCAVVHENEVNAHFPLLFLLPDKDFIKAAVEQLKGNNNYRADSSKDLSLRKVYRQILQLTQEYCEAHLEQKDSGGVLDKKNKIFVQLKDVLQNTNKTKNKRLEDFVRILQHEDPKMLSQHRTDAWKRYLSNVFSFLTVLPAIGRACRSYYKYDTVRFWKPESEQVKVFALHECEKIGIKVRVA